MADPKPEPTTDDKQGDLAVVKDAPPPDSGERKVPESALKTQAADFNATIAKLTKQVNDNAAASLKSKEDKLKADNKLQELLNTRDKTIADMTASAATSARSILEGTARDHLRNLGMSDPLYLTGAIAGLPGDATSESIETWAKTMKVDNESAFTKSVKPLNMGSTGPPAIDAGSANWKDVETQMQSDDPKVRKQARDLMTAYYQTHGKFPD